jgi:hypothetical protein|tara:strand:+ start:97 stop:417 length:321 start_codon:yes stop_codon:yes gene_type:complete
MLNQNFTTTKTITIILRHTWPRLLGLTAITSAIALTFWYAPELTDLPGDRVNRWSVLAWIFLATINVSMWMQLFCQAKGHHIQAAWWQAVPNAVALALIVAVLFGG